MGEANDIKQKGIPRVLNPSESSLIQRRIERKPSFEAHGRMEEQQETKPGTQAQSSIKTRASSTPLIKHEVSPVSSDKTFSASSLLIEQQPASGHMGRNSGGYKGSTTVPPGKLVENDEETAKELGEEPLQSVEETGKKITPGPTLPTMIMEREREEADKDMIYIKSESDIDDTGGILALNDGSTLPDLEAKDVKVEQETATSGWDVSEPAIPLPPLNS